jgi:hypothetical protein
MEMKTEMNETHEINKGITDLVTPDQMVDRIYSYLSDAPLNIRKDEYCYVKIVKNHLEVGRAKIILEE